MAWFPKNILCHWGARLVLLQIKHRQQSCNKTTKKMAAILAHQTKESNQNSFIFEHQHDGIDSTCKRSIACTSHMLVPPKILYGATGALKLAGLHYQSFCDHSRNFAQVYVRSFEGTDLYEMFEGLTESFPSNISYISFKA